MSDMSTLAIARRLAELGETEKACRAYTLAVQKGLEDDPAAELEAAMWILQFGGDYKISYHSFYSLYQRGLFRQEVLSLMRTAFYEPNVREQKARYERACRLLAKYPYFFRKDFPAFEDLPIQFFPYDEFQYLPFYPAEGRFGDWIDFKEPVIRHYFFHDLENPILAEDIFSQYELEYLNDNVRKSEYVARENHIYLHYTDGAVFCSYLQCWNLRALLKEEKFVFLIEDEISQYPIDFKARFGLDYSRYSLKPIGIREVSRLIWHTQLSSHNGGDFFNEIFDAHPNLIVMPSMMLSNIEKVMEQGREIMDQAGSNREAAECFDAWDPRAAQELYTMKGRTGKDYLVGLLMNDARAVAGLDPASRIAPALFLQPHFSNVVYRLQLDDRGRAALVCKQYEKICRSPVFRDFKYIKTFTPLRRITTSHGATVKFMFEHTPPGKTNEDGMYELLPDVLFDRLINRGFMVDPQDRLYKDSILVRFEDGKLNPRATFTALAEFLDLPYTESLTYCSQYGHRDVCSLEGNVKGFDPATVYRTYDDYVDDAERSLIEYFCRDVYGAYGYDFQYYDGKPMGEERVKALLDRCEKLTGLIRESFRPAIQDDVESQIEHFSEKAREDAREKILEDIIADMNKERFRIAQILMHGLHFVNQNGQPLQMMRRLELDPALLEQPLYH